jgi:hypothetical protein
LIQIIMATGRHSGRLRFAVPMVEIAYRYRGLQWKSDA